MIDQEAGKQHIHQLISRERGKPGSADFTKPVGKAIEI